MVVVISFYQGRAYYNHSKSKYNVNDTFQDWYSPKNLRVEFLTAMHCSVFELNCSTLQSFVTVMILQAFCPSGL